MRRLQKHLVSQKTSCQLSYSLPPKNIIFYHHSYQLMLLCFILRKHAYQTVKWHVSCKYFISSSYKNNLLLYMNLDMHTTLSVVSRSVAPQQPSCQLSYSIHLKRLYFQSSFLISLLYFFFHEHVSQTVKRYSYSCAETYNPTKIVMLIVLHFYSLHPKRLYFYVIILSTYASFLIFHEHVSQAIKCCVSCKYFQLCQQNESGQPFIQIHIRVPIHIHVLPLYKNITTFIYESRRADVQIHSYKYLYFGTGKI